MKKSIDILIDKLNKNKLKQHEIFDFLKFYRYQLCGIQSNNPIKEKYIKDIEDILNKKDKNSNIDTYKQAKELAIEIISNIHSNKLPNLKFEKFHVILKNLCLVLAIGLIIYSFSLFDLWWDDVKGFHGLYVDGYDYKEAIKSSSLFDVIGIGGFYYLALSMLPLIFGLISLIILHFRLNYVWTNLMWLYNFRLLLSQCICHLFSPKKYIKVLLNRLKNNKLSHKKIINFLIYYHNKTLSYSLYNKSVESYLTDIENLVDLLSKQENQDTLYEKTKKLAIEIAEDLENEKLPKFKESKIFKMVKFSMFGIGFLLILTAIIYSVPFFINIFSYFFTLEDFFYCIYHIIIPFLAGCIFIFLGCKIHFSDVNIFTYKLSLKKVDDELEKNLLKQNHSSKKDGISSRSLKLLIDKLEKNTIEEKDFFNFLTYYYLETLCKNNLQSFNQELIEKYKDKIKEISDSWSKNEQSTLYSAKDLVLEIISCIKDKKLPELKSENLYTFGAFSGLIFGYLLVVFDLLLVISNFSTISSDSMGDFIILVLIFFVIGLYLIKIGHSALKKFIWPDITNTTKSINNTNIYNLSEQNEDLGIDNSSNIFKAE